MRDLRKFQSKSEEVDRLYQNVSAFAAQFRDKAILDGVVLKNVALVSGDTTVNHGLGRKWQGWILIDKQGAADIYATSTKQTNRARSLVLTASAAVTASLYVF